MLVCWDEDFLVGSVGEEAAIGAPALLQEAAAYAGGALAVLLGDVGVAEGLLEIRRLFEGAEIFEGGDAGFAVGRVGGDFLLVLDPIDESPPRGLGEQAVGALVLREPAEDAARAFEDSRMGAGSG